MISIENFYWVLFENLLRPTGLDCWYYYPWGTKQNISSSEFKKFESLNDSNHVLFHFDQEPLWSEHLGMYDSFSEAWSTKLLRILANSERSDFKKNLCRSRGFMDWYYFYHGFAALNWYRDAEHLSQDHQIKDAFLSLNHVFDQRAYRLALVARLLDRNIAHRGSISFHATTSEVQAELRDPNSCLSKVSRSVIERNMSGLSDLPWRLDDVPVNGDLSARFGHQEYQLWQNSLMHIVNETVFYQPKLHLTEKVFKPIVAQRPFVLAAAPGNLAYLRGYGFRTFSDWIDEGYDNIQCPDKRLDAIADEVCRFANMDINELRRIHHDMSAVLTYNKRHFFGHFREIIVEELVDNFAQCIRVWNNNRADGRERPWHPDLDLVKQMLLR